MNTIIFGRLVTTVILISALSSTAQAQDFSKSVDLSGVSAAALVQSTGQVVVDGTPLTALKSYEVGLSATDGSQTVTFQAPDGTRHAYAVANDVVRQSASGATGTGRALDGTYAVALYYAHHIWQETPAAQKDALHEAAVRMVHPYANMQNLFWVYFVPPGLAAKPRGGTATLGCGPELGYSVDIGTGSVKQLKPVC